MEFLKALIALIPMIVRLINLFIKTPNDKRKELLDQMSNAFKKAEDEKDLSDLSRLINE